MDVVVKVICFLHSNQLFPKLFASSFVVKRLKHCCVFNEL